MKFATKPMTIEAMQFDGMNDIDLASWICENMESTVTGYPDSVYMRRQDFAMSMTTSRSILQLKTLSGWVDVKPEDWVVIGANKDELYPVNPKVFAQKYEAVR